MRFPIFHYSSVIYLGAKSVIQRCQKGAVSMDFLDRVTLNDLNEQQRAEAETIGFDTYIDLVRSFGGGYVYFPLAETLARRYRDEQIKSEYPALTVTQLARKYKLSLSSIREIIKSK